MKEGKTESNSLCLKILYILLEQKSWNFHHSATEMDLHSTDDMKSCFRTWNLVSEQLLESILKNFRSGKERSPGLPSCPSSKVTKGPRWVGHPLESSCSEPGRGPWIFKLPPPRMLSSLEHSSPSVTQHAIFLVTESVLLYHIADISC